MSKLTTIIDPKVKSDPALEKRTSHIFKTNYKLGILQHADAPIENRLADLWCIADAVQPGVLSDLKSFSLQFESEGTDLSSLREIVWQDEEKPLSAQPLKMLLRRLKNDKLDGLPKNMCMN